MKLRKNRRGFTIVELVIVVAVIGVLAAVLIPTFVNLTNKANRASDNSLVTNLNTALAGREGEEDDTKNETMHDAVEDLEKWGYKLENLVTKHPNDHLLYDLKENRFLLESNAVQGKETDYWQIVNAIPSTQKYNYYASNKFSAAEVTVSVGFDVGDLTSISSITYTNETDRTAIIRSNDGYLLVDAPLGTVHHYSWLDKLTVGAVADESYHEHGWVRVSATINDGHVVVEDGASINEVNIPSTASNDTSVSVSSNSSVGTLVVDSTTAEVEVEEGATVEQVVGETSNITGEGAAAATENAVEKVYVSNKTELDNAIANANALYIVLSDNIDAEDRVVIDRNVTIDGSSNKYALSVSKENKSDGRAINIGVNAQNANVTLKNLKVVGPTSGGYTRGVNIGQSGTIVIIDNCEISCEKYYAINIVGSASNISVKIINSKVTGWSAINCWSNNYSVEVISSTLIGTNPYASTGGAFGTIVFETDVTNQTNMFASMIRMRLLNCDVQAVSTNGGWQCLVGFWSNAISNILELDNCTYEISGDRAYVFGVYNTANTVIMDGETISFPQNGWYR